MQSETVNSSNASARQVATYALAASIFCLSVALVYFTWKLGKISEQVPAMLKSVEQTSNQIAPVLDEIRQTREQIPEILHQVEQTRNTIPAVIKATDNVSTSIVIAANEIKATRPLIPGIINEVKTTREAIPGILDRADKLVLNASKAGKEASKGAVSGVLTGIVTAPFEIVGSLGKKLFSFSAEEIRKLSDRDVELSKKAVVELLASDKINQTSGWENPENNTRGTVALLNIKTDNDRICKIINMKVWENNQLFVDKNITVCLNENNEWEQITS